MKLVAGVSSVSEPSGQARIQMQAIKKDDIYVQTSIGFVKYPFDRTRICISAYNERKRDHSDKHNHFWKQEKA